MSSYVQQPGTPNPPSNETTHPNVIHRKKTSSAIHFKKNHPATDSSTSLQPGAQCDSWDPPWLRPCNAKGPASAPGAEWNSDRKWQAFHILPIHPQRKQTSTDQLINCFFWARYHWTILNHTEPSGDPTRSIRRARERARKARCLVGPPGVQRWLLQVWNGRHLLMHRGQDPMIHHLKLWSWELPSTQPIQLTFRAMSRSEKVKRWKKKHLASNHPNDVIFWKSIRKTEKRGGKLAAIKTNWQN